MAERTNPSLPGPGSEVGPGVFAARTLGPRYGPFACLLLRSRNGRLCKSETFLETWYLEGAYLMRRSVSGLESSETDDAVSLYGLLFLLPQKTLHNSVSACICT